MQRTVIRDNPRLNSQHPMLIDHALQQAAQQGFLFGSSHITSGDATP